MHVSISLRIYFLIEYIIDSFSIYILDRQAHEVSRSSYDELLYELNMAKREIENLNRQLTSKFCFLKTKRKEIFPREKS